MTISSLIRNLFQEADYTVISIGKMKGPKYLVRTTRGQFVFSRENYPLDLDETKTKAILSQLT